MAAISRNLEQIDLNFPLYSGTTQNMRLQFIIEIPVKFRSLRPEQRFDNTFWILLMQQRQQIQTNQTLICPTLQVEPNYAEVTTPLTDLTRKGQPNKVTCEKPQQIAFQK